MKIGTYYYPEQWPREQWERDFDNMQAMGLQIVHMGEFAWFTMEPSPGDFQLDWLELCVEMAAKRKMDVILCTPTAAPPVWLWQEHPETLPIDIAGVPRRFGGRRHYTPTTPAMRDATRRIVTALADRFGQHPAVIGWQIDNEYSNDFDQTQATHRAFQGWLRRRYESIDNLNRAWGNQFWNTYYTSFDQILMPPDRNPRYANPHHVLDASRFWSWAFADFNRMQAQILRPRIGQRFITTNFMPFHLDCNPRDFADDLTLFAWDSYPVNGRETRHLDDELRLADPGSLGFMHDLMASYTGRHALLEVQLGQVNWGGVPLQPYPGAVRLWLWTAWGHGAELITTYRYRQPRWGIELFHNALVGPDGVTPSSGGKQFTQVIEEMKRVAPRQPAAAASGAAPGATAESRRAIQPPQPRESRVGILFDFEQLWYYAILPQARRWDQKQWITSWYAALARLALPIQVLHADRGWPADLALVVAPGVQMVDEPLIARFDEYASAGGHLLLTCRTALMDRNGQLFEGPLAKPILPLIGGSIEGYDGLPAEVWGAVELDGVSHRWGAWGDQIRPGPDTQVLARYADQFYAGAAAITRRRHGRGSVTYCGVYAEASLCDALVEKTALAAGLAGRLLPPRTQLLRRGRHRILLNYRDTAVEAPAPETARFVLGGRMVQPADVAVWEE